MAGDATPRTDDKDWAGRATELIETIVETIRDHSVRPIQTVLRAVTTGLVIALIALVALVVLAIGLVRLFDVDVFGGRVWATDLLVGGIFLGLALLSFTFGARWRKSGGTK